MSDAESDHYATLGLDRSCGAAQIRAAYRVLSKQHHPDLNPDAPDAVARAQELNAAHEILSDPIRRRAYDRELAAGENSDKKTAGRIQQSVKQDVNLALEDFLRGVSLEVRVNDPGNPNGSETYDLKIPPGTAPGARFRIPRDAPFERGFVEVRVRARPNFRFKVRGSDLQCDLRVSAQRAANGGHEMTPSLHGSQLRVRIPAGIKRGETIRIAGEGLPKSRGGRGDLIVRLVYRPDVRVARKTW